MPNTSIHLPQALLPGLDRVAAERGISRNRLIVESCRRVVEERSCWPPELFSNDHLSDVELQELQEAEDFRAGATGNEPRSRATGVTERRLRGSAGPPRTRDTLARLEAS